MRTVYLASHLLNIYNIVFVRILYFCHRVRAIVVNVQATFTDIMIIVFQYCELFYVVCV